MTDQTEAPRRGPTPRPWTRDFIAGPFAHGEIHHQEWDSDVDLILECVNSSHEKESAIEGLVEAALEAVRVAQEEGSGSYESTLELADALRAARLAGLTKDQ